MTKRVVSFPHLGSYYIAEKTAGILFGDEVIAPPQITRRTLEIGTKYSPESACIPFKYTLGNFIEALENGANVLVQMGGGCRMGFYGEVQKVILRKLGYQFEFVKLINDHHIINVIRNIKQINSHLSYMQIVRTLYLAYRKAHAIDHIEKIVRENIGFEAIKGAHEGCYRTFLRMLDRAQTGAEIRDVCERTQLQLQRLAIHKPENPLRVGIVGEIYVVMEPFSNFFIEKELAQYGIEVHRFMTISRLVHQGLAYQKHIRHVLSEAHPYIHHAIGAHGTESVAKAVQLARRGFEGLIHVKPFGCMPEINAMPALNRVSRDYQFPILYFSFDTLTSEIGIKTRLEAFYDMLIMKRGGDDHKN